MEKILTVPAPVAEERVYVTGNHHVSLAHIGEDGRIYALSHLSRAGGAMVEYTGRPLMELALDGQPLIAQRAEYTHAFIPAFHSAHGDVEADWEIFAPEGIRGFVVRVRLYAKSPQTLTLGLHFVPKELRRSLFHSRTLKADAAFSVDSWTGAAAAEYTAGFGISALAISGEEGFTAAADAEGLTATQQIDLAENSGGILQFFAALGAEQDGACLANMDMRRRGKTLYSDYIALLDKRFYPIADPVLERRVNLNLNFCYYFSLGYPLDGGDLMLTTSKSSRYYVSGAYWARDSLLWAFPAVLRLDAPMAKRMLERAFTVYLEQGANHALYLNGANLYPGFELDQLMAPLIALERYVNRVNDAGILRQPEIRQGAEFILAQLDKWQDGETGLYRTELNPSDDPVAAPCLIYCNALVLAALRFYNAHFGDVNDLIQQLRQSLKRHGIMETGGGPIYAWAVGGDKEPEQYDDPPGSLLLMPYYGWPDSGDEVYKNTVKHFFSPENEYFWQKGPVLGQGCEHAPDPWPMSLCNMLLAGAGEREELLSALRAMTMDNGIACETVWTETGAVKTGAAFATFAGFYANAIIEAFENEG